MIPVILTAVLRPLMPPPRLAHRGRPALGAAEALAAVVAAAGREHALALSAADLEEDLGVHALAIRKRRSTFLPCPASPGRVTRSVLADVKAWGATRAFDLCALASYL